MSDERLRALERAARANMDDADALCAFARAYLRSTAPPVAPTISPDMLLEDLTVELVKTIDGVNKYRQGEVVRAVYVMRASTRMEPRRDERAVNTIRDFVLRWKFPEMLANVGKMRGDIIRLVVRASGLEFSDPRGSL